jgi:DNA invertase Pin-like site-specific DNA recombinase
MQIEYRDLQQDYAAAVYCRLSRDDGTDSESNSIQTQRQMLRRYASENGFSIYDEYVDDGYSGTTFDRPDFNRMIRDIGDGHVNVIITKDLSRLGRNNALVAHYTEIFFPENDIRYIAVTDGIDTFRGDNEIMPFKSIVNEYYAKDISKKIRSSFVIKSQNGEFIGSKPPYGYQKDPDNKNKLIPDEITSIHANEIFERIVAGHSPYSITKYFLKNKVLKPRCYDDIKEGRKILEQLENPYKWHESSVVKIVKNPVYLGHMVNHKNVTRSYKIKKRIDIPTENQIVVENTHEALVDESTFEIANKMVKVKKKRAKDGQAHIFTGLLKCGDCGKSMVYNTTSKSNPYAFYACSNSKRNGKQACSYHYTRYDHLYEVILQDISKQVKLAKIGDKEFREYLTNANQQRQKAKVKKMTKVRAKSNKRFAELDLIIKRLYEDNVLGKISDERFMILTKSYEKEQSDLKETLEALDEQLAEIEIQNLNSYQFTRLIKQYTEITELTAPLLKELVDKIVIHQSEMRNGQRKQEIDIYYRFIGTI